MKGIFQKRNLRFIHGKFDIFIPIGIKISIKY